MLNKLCIFRPSTWDFGFMYWTSTHIDNNLIFYLYSNFSIWMHWKNLYYSFNEIITRILKILIADDCQTLDNIPLHLHGSKVLKSSWRITIKISPYTFALKTIHPHFSENWNILSFSALHPWLQAGFCTPLFFFETLFTQKGTQRLLNCELINWFAQLLIWTKLIEVMCAFLERGGGDER